MCVCVCGGGGGGGTKTQEEGEGWRSRHRERYVAHCTTSFLNHNCDLSQGAPGDVQQPRTSPQEASHSKWVTVGSMLKP